MIDLLKIDNISEGDDLKSLTVSYAEILIKGICGTCEKVCLVANNSLTVCDKESVPKVYAIKYNNEAIRMESSSGGFFFIS